MNALLLALALFAAPPGPPTDSPAPEIEPIALGETLAANLQKTLDAADADIVSEGVSGGYRIGLVLAPGRFVRARSPGGKFIDSSPPDADLTFVGVVLREPRTKRFLPAANVKVILEQEGGGDVELPELVGPYPLYGANLRLPAKGLLGITVVAGPPAYHRHAEMLAAFSGEGTVRFALTPRAGKTTPHYAVTEPKKPEPPAADWVIGNDLRQAVGEARSIVRSGEFLVGFIAEGPEPIWLWKGAGMPPEHCAVTEKDTNHLEAIVIHEPTGLMVTGATVGFRFSRLPNEQHDYLLRPLLAEFYHYGLTAAVPPGTWKVAALVDPPRGIAAWGKEPKGIVASPQTRLLASFTFEREAQASSPLAEEARQFAERLALAVDQYADGDRKAATDAVTETFFAFEGSRLDARLRTADPSAYKALEGEWIAMRGRMQAGAKPTEIGIAADRIGKEIMAQAAKVEGDGAPPSGASAFVQSLIILLREGFEAILVLGLLVAVLRKANRPEGVRLVYGGAIAALAASLVLGGAVVMLLRNVKGMGAAQEAFEGIVILASVVVLFFTSYWLISRVEGRRWAMFVKHQIEGALTGGRRWAILSLAFLVVFREGAETVLMYASLFSSASSSVAEIVGGMAVASVLLVVIFVASVIGGAKLPVRPFFAISGALLYLLAFKFAGDGVSELQAAGWISVSPVTWVPEGAFFRDWLGVRPTLETTILQGVLVLAVIAGIVWTIARRPDRTAPAGGAVAG